MWWHDVIDVQYGRSQCRRRKTNAIKMTIFFCWWRHCCCLYAIKQSSSTMLTSSFSFVRYSLAVQLLFYTVTICCTPFTIWRHCFCLRHLPAVQLLQYDVVFVCVIYQPSSCYSMTSPFLFVCRLPALQLLQCTVISFWFVHFFSRPTVTAWHDSFCLFAIY